MKKLRIVFVFFKQTPTKYWPCNLAYFLGMMVKKMTGMSLFKEKVLRLGLMKLAGDISGGSGLVFLYEVCFKRTYESVPVPPNSIVRVVFDVGANCGFFALSRCLADHILQAYCFEPHPKTFAILQKNVVLNSMIHRVTPVRAAVGAESGTCTLQICDDSSMGAVVSTGTDKPRNLREVQVRLISLDDFAVEHDVWADLIKIDVEGFELEVLRGAGKCLSKAKRVVLEYHTAELKELCLGLLCQAGFQSRVHGSLIFADARAGL